MMTEEEGWITYGLEAIDYVLQQKYYGNNSGKPFASCDSFLTTMHTSSTRTALQTQNHALFM